MLKKTKVILLLGIIVLIFYRCSSISDKEVYGLFIVLVFCIYNIFLKNSPFDPIRRTVSPLTANGEKWPQPLHYAGLRLLRL